jgi:hypothetical protein
VIFFNPLSAMGEFQLKLKRKFVPDTELLADLRRVAALLQHSAGTRQEHRAGTRQEHSAVTREAYTAHGRFNGATLAYRFGGWGQALAAAGLPPTGYRYVRDEALFENLAAAWRSLGRQPVMADMHPAAGVSLHGPGTYQKRFGSWNAALLRFSAYRDGSDWRSGSRGDARARRPQPPAPSPEEKGGTATARSRRIPGWRLRARVLLRDHSTCQMCGASPAKDPQTVLHVDHIVPWSKGGETVEANLRTLCAACNVGRGTLNSPQMNADER